MPRICIRGSVWRSSVFGAAVDGEGRGAVVRRRYDHVGAELAGGDRHAGLPDRINERVEPDAALLGWRRAVEGRSAAAAGGGGDGEVADEEDGAAGLAEVEVEMLVGVAEDAEGDELVGGPGDLVGGLAGVDGGEDEQAGADLADDAAGDFDFRPRDPLDDGDHARLPCVRV